jgi:Na+/proline symporter/nitrogen-specific signal transduction histidine kinase
MNIWIVIISALAYFGVLFSIAYYSDRKANKGKSIVSNPYVYALSMAVFCTAWTFYGSVGRAASNGVGFLPIYLGPSLTAPLWLLILRKIIIISKRERITSIADFISARYGKSAKLGVLATVVAVVGIIPYISIQLKAIATSFEVLTQTHLISEVITETIFLDTSHYVTILLGIFTILFGARHLESTERHEGLVTAIAFESIVKLVAFVAVGIFVTYFVYDGFGDIFSQALAHEKLQNLFSLQDGNINGWEWSWLTILSMFAILLLPRQFHVNVVENTSSKHLNKAMWLFPLYLLVINIFVLPIAFGGEMHFTNGDADMYVLSLPMAYDKNILALMVFLGGLSAATSMVIVATIALSIMISNNIFLPAILKISPYQEKENDDSLTVGRLLLIRRMSIILVLVVAYIYYKSISTEYALVSIGLISFAAVAQFAPALIGGIYWKRATQRGAYWGLMAGFIVWAYTLPLPTLAEVGIISNHFLENGLFGFSWLRPTSLFNLMDASPISQASFWSLFINTVIFVTVSLMTTPSAIEHRQANIFVDIYKYANETVTQEVLKRSASLYDIQILVTRFLGKERATELLANYALNNNFKLDNIKNIDADFINHIENVLAGAIGAASARILLTSIVKEDPISLEEVMGILDQTQEIMQYSKALEKKSKELELTTEELKTANERLKELDYLKDDFITTVTHELRTPITSIKALAKILYDNPTLENLKKEEFLGIIVSESERITRLINQILDLEKFETKKQEYSKEVLDFRQIVNKAIVNITAIANERHIKLGKNIHPKRLQIIGNEDQILQVIMNLLSNALKFCDENNGQVTVVLEAENHQAILKIKDNGKGISEKDQQIIFDRFTQISDAQLGKPKGSGLGLSISKTIIQNHKGKLEVESEVGEGAIFMIRLPLFM